jgi:hypothetical protein
MSPAWVCAVLLTSPAVISFQRRHSKNREKEANKLLAARKDIQKLPRPYLYRVVPPFRALLKNSC